MNGSIACSTWAHELSHKNTPKSPKRSVVAASYALKTPAKTKAKLTIAFNRQRPRTGRHGNAKSITSESRDDLLTTTAIDIHREPCIAHRAELDENREQNPRTSTRSTQERNPRRSFTGNDHRPFRKRSSRTPASHPPAGGRQPVRC